MRSLRVCLCVCAHRRDVITVMTSLRHQQIATSPAATLNCSYSY